MAPVGHGLSADFKDFSLLYFEYPNGSHWKKSPDTIRKVNI